MSGRTPASRFRCRTAPGPRPPQRSTVSPAPLLPNLITVTPNGDCAGTNNLCSGGTGTATVVVTGPGGGGHPGTAGPLRRRLRQLRAPDGQSRRFRSRRRGPSPPTPMARRLSASSSTSTPSTQIATIRATDVTTGNQVTGNFTIQEVVDGSAVLSVIPTGTTTITGPDDDDVLDRRRRRVLHLRRHAAVHGRCPVPDGRRR